MKKNMGITDRIIRTLLAITFIILFATGVLSGIWGTILLILAGIFLLTSIIGFCPLYLPFGIKTICKSCEKAQ
ncbi:MAG TPA: DUF2892 domain-containing protein [Bacteroidales bacterium]|nr:DUF2892 domain-containing protein [Bacteroidales bacterium]